MNLEFKIYELRKKSEMYQKLVQDGSPNEFIIVGEELIGKKIDCFKVQQIDNNGIRLIGGLKIDQAAFLIDKTDLEVKSDGVSCEIQEFDIPKKYLTMKIIENIQRLNS